VTTETCITNDFSVSDDWHEVITDTLRPLRGLTDKVIIEVITHSLPTLARELETFEASECFMQDCVGDDYISEGCIGDGCIRAFG
jgi:hypothetical protein